MIRKNNITQSQRNFYHVFLVIPSNVFLTLNQTDSIFFFAHPILCIFSFILVFYLTKLDYDLVCLFFDYSSELQDFV